jgi:hypothetical protein
MGYLDDLYGDNQGLVVASPTVTSNNKGLPYTDERGFVGDTASSLGRGVLGLVGKGAKAFEVLTPFETGLDEWATKTREETEFFKPDESEYYQEKGAVGKGWQGAMESIVPSLAGFAPGAAAGAAIGSAFGVIGSVPGAAIGGILSTLGLFGAGTYGEAKEAALANGLDEESAHTYALKQGLIEGGIEGVASGIEAYTAGLGSFFTKPLSQTLKGLLKVSGKDIAKAYGKTMAVEGSTEALQSGLGAQTDLTYGMGDTSVTDAAIDSIIPSLFMSGIFATGGQMYNARQKARLASDLQSGDAGRQVRAVNALRANIEKSDPELAKGLQEFAKANIGKPMDLNVNMIDMMEEVRQNELDAAERINPLGDIDALTQKINGQLLPPAPYDQNEDLNDPLVIAFQEQEARKRNSQAINKKGSAQMAAEETDYSTGAFRPENAVRSNATPAIDDVSSEARAKQESARSIAQRQERQQREKAAATPPAPTAGEIDLTDSYEFIKAEAENLRTQVAENVKTRSEIRTTVDQLVEGGSILPEERELMEDAYWRENDGVEKTPEQELLISRISTGVEATPLEGPKLAPGAYVSPEGTEAPVEGEDVTEGQMEALPDVDAGSAYEGDTTVPAVGGVEDQFIAAEEAQELKETEPESLLTPETERTEVEVSPVTQMFIDKDTKAIKSEIIKMSKEMPTGKKSTFKKLIDSGDITGAQEIVNQEIENLSEDKAFALSEDMKYFVENQEGMDQKAKDSWIKKISSKLPKGQGRAAAFETLAEQAQAEATQKGIESEVDIDLIKPEVTFASSSRKSTAPKIGKIKWTAMTDTLQSGSDQIGNQYVLDSEGKTLNIQSKDGTWVSVEGSPKVLAEAAKGVSSGKVELKDLQKAVDVEAKKEYSSVEKEEDLTSTELNMEGIDDEGEFTYDDVVVSDGETTDTVAKRFEGGTRVVDGYTMLQELKADRENVGPSVRDAMEFLLRLTPEEKLRTFQIKPMSQAPANQQQENSMYLSEDHTFYYGPGATERTIVHEMMHGVTVREMRQLGLNHPVVQNLKSVAKAYEGYLKGQKMTERQQYTFKSPFEFISMAMTEPEIQADLKAIPVPEGERTGRIKSLWDKVVNAIRRGFRLPSKYNSALEEVMAITADLSHIELAKRVASTSPRQAELVAQGMSLEESGMIAGDSGVYSDFTASQKKTLEWIKKTEAEEKQGKYWFTEPLKKGLREVDKYIKPVASVVKDIAPKIYSKLMEMESTINSKNQEYRNEIEGFVKKYEKLNDDEKKLMNYALLNSNNPEDAKDLNALLRSKGMTQDFAKVQGVLDSIKKDYERVGLNLFNRIDNYYPRKVKDVKGLMAYIRATKAKQQGKEVAGGTGVFDDILEDVNLSDKQKEDRIAEIINSGYNPATALKIPTSTKSRSIAKVNPAMMEFYHNPIDSLVDTIFEGNEAIATRDFVGVDARKRLTKDVNRLHKKLLTQKPGTKGYQTTLGEINTKTNEIRDIAEVSEESISQLISKDYNSLPEDQQDALLQALRSRLNQRGMHGGAAKLRDIGLITALGSPLNAVTQLGDLVWSLYENGPTNTIRAIFGNKEITTKDLDMSHVLKEFAQGSTAKWVDKTMKWTGLNFMDQFGKNVNMQAALNKARGTSKEDFVSKYEEILTPETAAKTWEDIQKGEISQDVKHFALVSVAKFQPVTLSEMPQQYLQSGNGRIFYTLKSYGIKALDNMRREIIGEYQKGNTAQASKNLMTLVPLLVLANASVDELKDWILGRDDAFSDQVWDNLLKLGMASRYTVDKGFRSGQPIATFVKDVLTPPGISVADPFLKDIYNMVSSDKEMTYSALKSVPLVGKLAYSRTSEGKGKESDRTRTSIYKDIRASVSDGNYSEVRKKINKYNRDQRKSGGEIIDNKTIRSIKSKERKKLREQKG